MLEAALQLNPSEMEIYEKLGVTYTRLGRFDDAQRMFTHMLSVSPNSATTYNNQGSLYLTQHRWDDAITACAAPSPSTRAWPTPTTASASPSRSSRSSTMPSPSGSGHWSCAPISTDARDNIARARQLLRR